MTTTAIAVKPLEWTGNYGKSAAAETLCYRILYNKNGGAWGNSDKGQGYYVERDIGFGRLVDGPFDDSGTAKAAAQADYEARILSALTAPPTAKHGEVGTAAPETHMRGGDE